MPLPRPLRGHPTSPSGARAVFSAMFGGCQPARRGLRPDEARVEQHGRQRHEGGRLRDAEAGEPAPRGGDRDSGDDQGVPDGPAADRQERDPDHQHRPDAVAEDGEQPRGDEVEVVLRLGDRVAGDRRGQRHCDRHADCEPGVQEAERRRPAPADEKERADAEQGRGEEPAEEVVDAEGGVAPPRGRSPGQGRRREGIRCQRRGPGGELRIAALAPAAGEHAGESKRKQRGGERKKRIHGVRVS